MWPSQPGSDIFTFALPKYVINRLLNETLQGDDHEFDFFNRRKLMGSLAAVASAVGAGALFATRAEAKNHDRRAQTESRRQACRRQANDHAADHSQRADLHCRAGCKLEWPGG